MLSRFIYSPPLLCLLCHKFKGVAVNEVKDVQDNKIELRRMLSSMMFGCAWLVTGTTLVAALEFTLSPQRVKIGSTGTLTMTCDVTEEDVALIYNIQIRRETEPGSNFTWEILAEVEAVEAEVPALDEDIINDKDFVAGGIFDKVNPIKTYLTLGMDIQKLTYSDARPYRCQLTYKSNITGSVAIVKRNVTLSVYGVDDHDKEQSDTRQCSGRVNRTILVIVCAVLGTTNVLTIVYVVTRRRSKAQRSFPGKKTGRELLPGSATHAKHDRPDGKETDDEIL